VWRQRNDESTNETRQSRPSGGRYLAASAKNNKRREDFAKFDALRRYAHRIQHARQASEWRDHAKALNLEIPPTLLAREK
jgi:ribosome-binding protein aMBF1 (putative translation factor)